jgi:hypothetical protein
MNMARQNNIKITRMYSFGLIYAQFDEDPHPKDWKSQKKTNRGI